MTRTPLWASIASELRAALAEGQYVAGDKLPTEAALSERFGVNRHTVRHALRALTEEGLLHPRRGAGVFVLGRPLDYPLSERVRFHQNLTAAGREPAKRVLSVEVVAAGETAAKRLDLAVGEGVAVVHSISLADDVPVAFAEARFPEVRHPGLADAIREETSVTRALAKVGVRDYTRKSTRVSAVSATAVQAVNLRIREGVPLLLTESLSVAQGRPVEHGRTWFASERVSLTVEH